MPPVTAQPTVTPPTFGSLPMNLVGLARDPLAFFLRAGRNSSPGVVRIALGPTKPVFLVNRGDLVEEILVTRRHEYCRQTGLGDIRAAVGENLITSDGYFHECHRTLANPIMDEASVTAYAEIVVDQADQAARRWRDDTVVEVHRDMLELTFRTAGRVLFDSAVETAPGVEDALEIVLSHCERYTQPLGSLLDRVPLPSTLRMRRGGRQLSRYLDEMILRCHAGDGASSVLGRFLAAGRGDDGGPALLSDLEARDEMSFIFLAARETIADVLGWLWFELSRAAETQQALHAELDSVLAGRLPGVADLPNLVLLGRVVKEALRLWPVGWVVLRQTVTEYPLGEYLLPAGAYVVVSPWVTHRDGRNFEQPDRFLPNRWAGAEPAPYTYFPFSTGPRTCLGSHFSAMALPLIVATMAQQWTFEHVRGSKARPVPHFAIRPADGIWLRLSRRS